MYWIDFKSNGRLAIVGRPRAGDWLDDEIAGWKTAGLDVVISLLEDEEVAELELQREGEVCRIKGIEYVSYPIIDRGVPVSNQNAEGISRRAAQQIAQGRSIAFHCRAGIGRSVIMAACTLICSGIEANQALADIRRARGVNVPDTEGQRKWILSFTPDDPLKALKKQVFR